MIKIVYNPNHPELIFAAAIIALDLQEKYSGERCCVFSATANDLNKDETVISKKIVKDLSFIMNEAYDDFLEPEKDGGKKDRYILLGIYPCNKDEERIVINFFEKNEKKLDLWIDWHDWPSNLSEFLQSQSDKIYLETGLGALPILKRLGHHIPKEYFEAEKAMTSQDMTNDLASRYLKILFLSRSLGLNNDLISSCDYFAFISSVDELATNQINEGLDQMAQMFNQMLEEADKIKFQFRDDIPEFQRAKEIGRPVGSIFLNEVSDFFFVEEVLASGLEKYPWLCIVGYMYGGIYKINFASTKIPISSIVEAYGLMAKDKSELFKILNEEIIRVGINP